MDTVELTTHKAIKCLAWNNGPAGVLGMEIGGGPVYLVRDEPHTYRVFRIYEIEYRKLLHNCDMESIVSRIKLRAPESLAVQSMWIQWAEMKTDESGTDGTT